MRIPASLAFIVASSLSVGCLSENEEVVFVAPSITAPAATITGGALGISVSGSFSMTLALGPRASGASQVQVGAFAITDANGQASIVPSLSLTPSVALPVTVEPDSEVTVDFTFDLGSKTVPAETQASLCAAAGVRIAGTIQDSLEDAATPVASATFKPTGCM
jgi:hypothetical protein